MEEIKLLIKKWKAEGIEARDNNNNNLAQAIHYKIIGLQKALEIIRKNSTKP